MISEEKIYSFSVLDELDGLLNDSGIHSAYTLLWNLLFKNSLSSSVKILVFLCDTSSYLFFLSVSCLQISCHRRFKLLNFSCRILASVFEDCWIISSPVAFSILTTVCRCPMPSWSSCKIPKTWNKSEAGVFFLREKIKQWATTCTCTGRERNMKAPRESCSMKLTWPYPKDVRQKDTFDMSAKNVLSFQLQFSFL